MNLAAKRKRFKRKFRTERDCIKYLVKHKWPEGFVCPKCGHNTATIIKTRHAYQCKKCHHQTSVTANTIFSKTRKPLRKWFWAIIVVADTNTGASISQLQNELDLSYAAAWQWRHKIRKAMRQKTEKCGIMDGLVEIVNA